MTLLDVGPMILGGNVFGWTSSRDDSFAVLDKFVDAGGRAIDTADVYGSWVEGQRGGESEELIGEWLAARPGMRDKVVIGTKVASLATRKGLSPDNIRAAADDSLARLKTDYLDIYYAHQDDPDVAQHDYLEAFNGLVDAGKIRTIAISNFSTERIASAAAITKQEGWAPISFSQDEYNLVAREIERGALPVLSGLGIREVPYFALAAGFLTGKYRPGVEIDSQRLNRTQRYIDNPRAVALLDVLDTIASAHNVPVAAVSLAWLRAQPAVAAPIASARTPEQLDDLVASFSLVLTPAELAELTQASA